MVTDTLLMEETNIDSEIDSDNNGEYISETVTTISAEKIQGDFLDAINEKISLEKQPIQQFNAFIDKEMSNSMEAYAPVSSMYLKPVRHTFAPESDNNGHTEPTTFANSMELNAITDSITSKVPGHISMLSTWHYMNEMSDANVETTGTSLPYLENNKRISSGEDIANRIIDDNDTLKPSLPGQLGFTFKPVLLLPKPATTNSSVNINDSLNMLNASTLADHEIETELIKEMPENNKNTVTPQEASPLVQLNVWNYLNGHLKHSNSQILSQGQKDIIHITHLKGKPKESLLTPMSQENSFNVPHIINPNKQKFQKFPLHPISPNNDDSESNLLKPIKDNHYESLDLVDYIDKHSTASELVTDNEEEAVPLNLYEFVMHHSQESEVESKRVFEESTIFEKPEEHKNLSKVIMSSIHKPISSEKVANVHFNLQLSHYKPSYENRSNDSSINSGSDDVSTNTVSILIKPNQLLPVKLTNSFHKIPINKFNATTDSPKTTLQPLTSLFDSVKTQISHIASSLTVNKTTTPQTFVKIPISWQFYQESSNTRATEAPSTTSTTVTTVHKNLSDSDKSEQNDTDYKASNMFESMKDLMKDKMSQSMGSNFNDTLLKIDSVTLVTEYIKRVSIISRLFKKSDINKPKIAGMIENLALQSLLSYVLGNDDEMKELEEQQHEPIFPNPQIEKVLASEMEKNISEISKLIIESTFEKTKSEPSLRDPSKKSTTSSPEKTTQELHTNQASSYLQPYTETSTSKVPSTANVNNLLYHEKILIKLLSTQAPFRPYTKRFYTTTTTTTTPAPSEPSLIDLTVNKYEEEYYANLTATKNQTFTGALKNTMTNITKMISDLVPNGATFQGCLNNRACAFALATSLAIGGVIAAPFVVPLGRRKKQLFSEESRIFGISEPINKSSYHDNDLMLEFQRILDFIAKAQLNGLYQLNSNSQILHVMNGNIIKYLHQEFDRIKTIQNYRDKYLEMI